MSEKRLPDAAVKGGNKTFFSLDELITVTVGKEQTKHMIHESILRQCPFFDKCLSSGMREEHEKSINLPDDDPTAIEVIIEWLYAKTIDRLQCGNHYIVAYVAADKYCMRELQNSIIDKLCSTPYGDVTPSFVSSVWNGTAEGSKLRELTLDFLHYCIVTRPELYKPSDGRYYKELQELMHDGDVAYVLMWRLADQRELDLEHPLLKKGCVYHVHEDGSACENGLETA
ncbi:hypothetical protein H2200_011888 [Cladophialophora chaetospira]|uniref:BTB domain-containing protein n=1 Tax=Cladophialophora chaetospira TaxID=386627 RepID=A0AA38WYW2_9EURO|nr:hypothetical protein H2200_011888 [Cladophialophora chaetospira]